MAIDVNKISEQTGIAVKQLNRLNKDKWYHGTTVGAYKNILEQGVISSYNIGSQLDFGAGFYLTDNIEAASGYMQRLPDIDENGTFIERTEWCVIEFSFNPYDILFDTYARVYKYRNFPKHDEDFAKFVFHNRLKNVYNESPHGYDIIWGVMSDSIPPEIILKYQNEEITYDEAILQLQRNNSMKQLYIGRQELCDLLEISNVHIFNTKEGK